MKRCPKCGTTKPYDDFWIKRRTSDGRQTYCKPCSTEVTKTRRHGRSADERFEDKIARKCWTYNITKDDLLGLLRSQGGQCPCGKALEWSDINIDHDHKCCPERSCGQCVRGVLCTNCNVALGMIKDDPRRAMALATYLLQFEDVLELLNTKGHNPCR